jgi:predicted amidophosphoribosyltransferase
VIHALKFSGRRRAAARLAEALLETEATRQLVATSDVLVAVPLHPRRCASAASTRPRCSRTRSRAAATARCCPDALVRRLDTAPQAGLSAAARRRNVRAGLRRAPQGERRRATVTLVDDVVTTGATALACGRSCWRRAPKRCDSCRWRASSEETKAPQGGRG